MTTGSRLCEAVCYAFALTLATPPRAFTQCDRLPSIVVDAGADACLSEPELRERVAEYAQSNSSCSAQGIQVAVQLRPTQSSVTLDLTRDGQLLSSRQFDNLPSRCDDARDMLAVSIALALDHLPMTQASVSAAKGASRAGTQRKTPGSSAAVARAAATNNVPDNVPDAIEPYTMPAAPIEAAETTRSEATPLTDSAAVHAEITPAADSQRPTEAPAAQASPPRDGVITPAQARPRVRSGSLHTLLYAGGDAMVRSLPEPIWLGAVGIELAVDAWSLRLGGLAGGATRVPLGRGSVALTLAGGELLGCGGVRLASIGAQLCTGALAAALRAHGRGFDGDLTATTAWAAATLALALRWPLDAPLALQVEARGLYNLVRPKLEVEGAGPPVLLAEVGASAGLGLFFALP